MLTLNDMNNKVWEAIKNIDYPYSEEFVHTHTHSELSFLDGAGKLDSLAKKCAESNTPFVLTDHGNVAGTIRAYKACKEHKIPFIRGMEAYIKKSNSEDEEEDYEGSYFHLILLPYTKTGFENINLLSSLGYVDGMTFVAGRGVPVIKKELLEKYSEGIVAMSACMFGEISANIWLHFPYIELLKKVKSVEYTNKLIRVGRKLIVKKKVLSKKSGLTVDDLTDDDVLDMILQKKRLVKLKDILLNAVSLATNEQIIASVIEHEEYEDRILNVIKYYIDLFDFFYLEIQDHGFVEQRLTTIVSKYISEKYDLPTKLVVTNDVHYIEKDDWEIQDVLLCISTKKTLSDKNRFKFNKHELYFKSPEELNELFQYLSEEDRKQYLKNSTEVVKICLNYKMSMDEMFYPKYDIPEGFKDAGEYLLYLSMQGAIELSKEAPKNFRYRIFNIVDFNDFKDSVYSNIDFDTAFEYVKDSTKQAQVMPLIMEGIKTAAVNILNISVSKRNISLQAQVYEKYLEAIERIIYEFAVIVVKEIPDYFLITRQIINSARLENIPVGPGRGSCAGSSIAYLLGITELDPIDYSLYFERFINPERNSYPDIDSDFAQRYLASVKENTSKYFGVENCCGVNAFGYIKNKKAIQDSFRVFDFEAKDYNKVSKEISNDFDIVESISEHAIYSEKYHNDENFKKAVDIASRITGNVRQAGTHAAGLIITPRGTEMFRKLPVMLTGGKGKSASLNSQYDKKDVEEAGFLKMDLLGLRNLDIIQDTLDLIAKYRGEKINIRTIPLNDAKTYDLYQKGDTDFVFQVESGGMKNFLKDLGPTTIEDIIVVLAGYRPGPMKYLMEYVEVRKGLKDAVYRDERLRPILEVTGGFPFYQEQIMDMFRVLAGYSLGRADLVRRAMGKKDKDILNQERANFIYGIQAKDENEEPIFNEDGTPVMEVLGCVNNGVSEEVASLIYKDIIPFAEYGFNKSHAAAYAIVSYRTGYLKANYFLEYATSVLRSVEENKEKLAIYANIIRDKGVKILFPDINKSNVHMDIYDFENNVMSTGLLAIKGLPEQTAYNVVAEREANGPFTSFTNFLNRMSKYHIDKKSVDALIGSGSFDCFDRNMKKMSDYFLFTNSKEKEIKPLKDETVVQKTIFDIPEFKKKLDYLQDIPDNNGYSLEERLSALCAYNNIGIHPDVISSYKNIKYDLMPGYNKNPHEDFESKKGIITGVLEDAFKLTKKGLAYITTMTSFKGDKIKIVLSKKNVASATNDVTQFKAGTVIDLNGSFKFPKNVANDGNDEDVENEEGDVVDTEVVAFPQSITIKELGNSFIESTIYLNLDKFVGDEKLVSNYFGANSPQEAAINLLQKQNSTTGKRVVLKYNGVTYKTNNRIDITLDDILKLGFEYKVN